MGCICLRGGVYSSTSGIFGLCSQHRVADIGNVRFCSRLLAAAPHWKLPTIAQEESQWRGIATTKTVEPSWMKDSMDVSSDHGNVCLRRAETWSTIRSNHDETRARRSEHALHMRQNNCTACMTSTCYAQRLLYEYALVFRHPQMITHKLDGLHVR